MLDLTDTIVPKSDQVNADDLMSGPRTFTISDVRKSGSPDQPVDVVLAEFPLGRPFKPSKSMRRVMVLAWGPDASTYVGRRLTLYRDPTIKFGGSEVGGIRISAMSHISEPLTMSLTVTRGKRAPFRVDVLPDAPTSPSVSPDMLAKLAELFDSKGVPEGERPDVQKLTVDEARNVWRTLQSRPDVEASA
jgi:hypothetical protein